MKKTIFIFTFFTFFLTYINAQEKEAIKEIGLNLYPLIDNTISLNFEYSKNNLLSYNAGTNILMNSKYKDKLITSGLNIFIGIRCTLFKKEKSSYLFMGVKALGGYYYQKIKHTPVLLFDWDFLLYNPDWYYKNNTIFSKGFFSATRYEVGYNLRINDKFHIEFGIEGGGPILCMDLYTNYSYYLFYNRFIGILKPKYVF